MSTTTGTISAQSASGVLEMVTKSAVRKTLVTPSTARIAVPRGSSVGLARVSVVGPPTGRPTVNFTAFGFGVPSGMIAMGGEASVRTPP